MTLTYHVDLPLAVALLAAKGKQSLSPTEHHACTTIPVFGKLTVTTPFEFVVAVTESIYFVVKMPYDLLAVIPDVGAGNLYRS